MASAPAESNGTRSRGLLLLAVVFLLGVVCGGALTLIGIRMTGPTGVRGPGPGRGGGHPGDVIAERLNLDDEQRERIREILDESRDEMHEVMSSSRERIREVLTPEQRERFDEMGETMRRRRGGRRGFGNRHGPPPGDPPPPD